MTVALLVNMLYSVVDRIYLGHIPGEGRLALTGIGLAFPIIAVISAFQRLCSDRRRPPLRHGPGRRRTGTGGNHPRKRLYFCCSFPCCSLPWAMPSRPPSYGPRARARPPSLTRTLSAHLSGGHHLRLAQLRYERLYHRPGLPHGEHDDRIVGGGGEYPVGPPLHLRIRYGGPSAALATVIAQFTSFLWVLLFLTSHRAILRLRLNRMRLQRNIVLPMLGLGLTGFTMSVTNSAVGMVYNASLQTLGGDLYVGVMTVVNSIREIIYMPFPG